MPQISKNDYTNRIIKDIETEKSKFENKSNEEIFNIISKYLSKEPITFYKQLIRYINDKKCTDYDELKEYLEKACKNNILKVNPNLVEKKYSDIRLYVSSSRGKLTTIVNDICNYDAKVNDRDITRYGAMFICFILSCSVEDVENIFLKKTLRQRGFNLKNPLDFMCYLAFCQKTNKYGYWLNLKNEFEKREIKTTKNKKYSETNVIRNDIEKKLNDIDFDNMSDVVDFVIDTMELSNEVMQEVNTGKDLIEYYNKHAKNIYCLTNSSISAKNQLVNLLMLNDIETFDEELNTLKSYRNEISANYKKYKDKLNLAQNKKSIATNNDIASFNKAVNGLEDIKKKIVKCKNEKTRFVDEYSEDNDFLILKLEIMADDIYLDYIPVELYNIRDKGLFNEKLFNSKTISDIANNDLVITREQLIMAALYYFTTSSRFKNRTYEDNFIYDFEELANEYLIKSGYGPLYPPNPFESIILLSLYTNSPLETMGYIYFSCYEKYSNKKLRKEIK